MRWTDVVIVALLVGVLFGLGEAVTGTVRHRIALLPTGEVVSGELFWYAPLAAAFSMLLIASALLVIDAVFGRRLRLRLLIPGVCSALGAYSLSRAMAIGIGTFAAIILAIGVGTVVTRIFARRPAPLVRIAKGTLGVAALGLVAWALLLPQLRRLEERRTLASLPDPPAGAPNVLVIIWDTVRALSTSVYGYDRETTPELKKLALEGAVFERAFATSPWSLPSHAGMYTGRYPHEMTVGFSAPLDDTHPTFAEVLSSRGYATAGFTANLFYGSRDYGIARGFTWYDERPTGSWRVILQTYWLTRSTSKWIREKRGDHRQVLRRHAADVNAELLKWVRKRGNRPFVAVVNHFDAHEPYHPPEPFTTAFTPAPPRYWIAEDVKEMTPEVIGQLRDAYDGSVRYMDHELGRLRTALDSLGVLDNTIIIVTSDHGEEFGEHGPSLQGHANSLYMTLLRVPLVLSYGKGVPAGVRVSESVSIRDIPATIMDLTGMGENHPFPGVSLARLARRQLEPGDATAPRLQIGEKHRWARFHPEWPTGKGDMFSLVRGDHHYIVNADGREELYDFVRDGGEQHDLADTPGADSLLQTFRVTLDSLVPTREGVRQARIRGRPTE